MEEKAKESTFHIRALGDRFDNEALSMIHYRESAIYLAHCSWLTYKLAKRAMNQMRLPFTQQT